MLLSLPLSNRPCPANAADCKVAIMVPGATPGPIFDANKSPVIDPTDESPTNKNSPATTPAPTDSPVLVVIKAISQNLFTPLGCLGVSCSDFKNAYIFESSHLKLS